MTNNFAHKQFSSKYGGFHKEYDSTGYMLTTDSPKSFEGSYAINKPVVLNRINLSAFADSNQSNESQIRLDNQSTNYLSNSPSTNFRKASHFNKQIIPSSKSMVTCLKL